MWCFTYDLVNSVINMHWIFVDYCCYVIFNVWLLLSYIRRQNKFCKLNFLVCIGNYLFLLNLVGTSNFLILIIFYCATLKCHRWRGILSILRICCEKNGSLWYLLMKHIWLKFLMTCLGNFSSYFIWLGHRFRFIRIMW